LSVCLALPPATRLPYTQTSFWALLPIATIAIAITNSPLKVEHHRGMTMDL